MSRSGEGNTMKDIREAVIVDSYRKAFAWRREQAS
jgi:hypothetical protein